MAARPRPHTDLHSFYRLLRRLRGTIPPRVIAARCELDLLTYRAIEAGSTAVEEGLAREILAGGFGLDHRDCERLIVGIKLYDVGLRDNYVRALATDVVLGTLPAAVREQVRELYRNYTSVESSASGT